MVGVSDSSVRSREISDGAFDPNRSVAFFPTRTFATLFDRVVGAFQEVLRNCEAKRSYAFAIGDPFEFNGCQTYRSLGLPLSVHAYNDNMDRAMTALEDARELIGQVVTTNVVAQLKFAGHAA